MTNEEQLGGGRTTPGVVRVGKTVRRPPAGNSGMLEALLVYMSERGFDGAPRFLGLDEQGRLTSSYIEGAVPSELGMHDDEVLGAAARLIRSYHDATAGFSSSFEIVCHNDLSPCNFVFVDGVPVGLIDFDAAAPGDRLWDLGYAAWLWLDIGTDELSPLEQQRRLDLFARAYDPELSIEALIVAMIGRQRLLAAEPGNAAREAWASDCLNWTLENIAP